MKALLLTKYGSPEDLKIGDAPKPIPQNNEVLISVHAASINDWDWGMVRGTPFYIRLLAGLFKPSIKIPGVDVAGVVEAVGPGVTGFGPGDRVYADLSETGFGAFAEYVCTDENTPTLMPATMTFEEAAALPHAACLAMQGLLDIGQLQKGQSLLVNGAGGGVGAVAAKIAHNIGLKKITGVDHKSKHSAMKTVGYTHLIDYTTEDFTCSGKQYDLILDAHTTRSAPHYLRTLTPGGKYVTVGGKTAPLFRLLLSSLIRNKHSMKQLKIVALKTNRDMDYINELYEKGQLNDLPLEIFPFENIAKAIAHFGSAKHKGKVIVKF